MAAALAPCGGGPPRAGGWQDTPAARSSNAAPLRPRALRRRRPRSIEVEPDQPQRIERDAAVRSEPMKVRAGHSPRCAHFTDLLAARHRVAHRDQGPAEMQ